MTFFEDLRVGDHREVGSHTFTADEIKAFAREFDPQPFHLDEEAAARSHFGALVASGWHTAAMCLRHVVADGQRRASERRSRGEQAAHSGPSPGLRDLKWPKPVYAGDTISFAVQIVELRDDAGHPGRGLRITRNTGTNQRGELVYTVLMSCYVERRPAALAALSSGRLDVCGEAGRRIFQR